MQTDRDQEEQYRALMGAVLSCGVSGPKKKALIEIIESMYPFGGKARPDNVFWGRCDYCGLEERASKTKGDPMYKIGNVQMSVEIPLSYDCQWFELDADERKSSHFTDDEKRRGATRVVGQAGLSINCAVPESEKFRSCAYCRREFGRRSREWINRAMTEGRCLEKTILAIKAGEASEMLDQYQAWKLTNQMRRVIRKIAN